MFHPGLTLNANNPLYNIVKAEYYFDNDPGFGNGINIPVTPGSSVSLAGFALNISMLTPGHHKLYFRMQDEKGNWSLTNYGTLNIVNTGLTLPSSAAVAPVVTAEYFFNTDPGFGNGIPMPVTAGMDVNFSYPVSSIALPAGAHKYYVRSKDQSGNWSLTQYKHLSVVDVTISLPPTPAPAPVTALEYFVDTDPGFGNGTITTVTPTQNLSNYNLSVATSGLADGLHRLWVRTLNPASVSMVKSFYVGIPLPLDFLSFSLKKDHTESLVSWEIAPDFEAVRFEVERSVDGKNFQSLGSIDRDNKRTQYEMRDPSLMQLGVSKVYYRVKAIQQSGKTVFTTMLYLNLDDNAAPYAFVFPNPVKDDLTVRFGLGNRKDLELQLVDNTGKLIRKKSLQLDSTTQEAKMDISGFVPGIYNLILTSGDWQKVIKVVKQ